MNNSVSQPEGSNREQHPILDLTATHHWACGMPLSYVLEVADHWLNRQDLAALRDPLLDTVSASAADTK